MTAEHLRPLLDLRVEGGESVLPFVRQFYASPSNYIWPDEHGIVHDVPQGKGGEQGDALMPALFSLGQHTALEAVQSQLFEGETFCVFLDDLYAIRRPDRAVLFFNLIQRELWTYSRIEVHLGKTQIWNRGGFEPFGCQLLTAAPRRVDPTAVVWRGDPTLLADLRGMNVLGTPLGHSEYVDAQLRHCGFPPQLRPEGVAPWRHTRVRCPS